MPRVLAPALVALAMLLGAALFLDWFVITVPDLGDAKIELRRMHGGGASLTLWSSIAFAVLIVMQAGARLLAAQVNPRFTRLGYLVGIVVFANTFMTAYFFGPDLRSEVMIDSELVAIERTSAGGSIAGMVALYYATLQESFSTAIVEPVKPDLAPARLLPATERPRTVSPTTRPQTVPATERPKTTPPPTRPQTVPPPESQRLSRPPTERPSTPRTITPHQLRGKLRFVVLTAELTRGGIDARRDDGANVLVIWRDVVGAVTRRLPAELEGATFVDIVSTTNATLRIVPWTRLSGDALEGEDRVLALLHYIVERCPDITLDPATRAFIEGRSEAAQLPDVATLAAHDARLS